MKNKIILSIILVYYNTPKEILSCLNSLKNSIKGISFEVIIIDNKSPLPLPKTVKIYNSIRVINNSENKGYGSALNQGSKIAKGEYLLLANPDLIFLKDSVLLMINRLMKDRSIGIIGPQLLSKNRKILKVGNDYPFLPLALVPFSLIHKLLPNNFFSRKYFLLDFDRKTESEIPVLAGACMMIKKDIFYKVGGFDEQFFMYFEEADLCLRVKNLGFKVLYFPDSKVIHLIGRSSNNRTWIRQTFEKSRFKFFKKYHGILSALFGESFLRSSRIISSIL